MDPILEEEQQHLAETYAKLELIEHDLVGAITADQAEAQQAHEDILEDLTIDLNNDVNLETYVELEALHQIIDGYNRTLSIREQQLAKVRLLLRQPYFAKVVLQFNPDEPRPESLREIYIGASGMTDETCRHFIIDWRSPVAEVYYNQENGRTSYKADSRTIEVDLKLRRQFDILGSTLKSYFDTTVAIQDQLLLASLKRTRSASLQAITTTIQKEQNAVIRHDDVPALLVSGIAGSGKTSVLLQRIAFLLYRERETLRPDDVYLITPNDVFARYIANVLPDMGERNPQTLTWDTLMERMGISNRQMGASVSAGTLRAIDEGVATLTLEARDMADIFVDDERVIAASQVFNIVKRHIGRIGCGSHLAGLVEEALAERIETRIKNRASNEDVQDALFELDTEEQFRLFGKPLHPNAEDDLAKLARIYLADRYEAARSSIERGEWLRIDRIGMRILGTKSLSAVEYLYCKLALTGTGIRGARYVMVDEVQDYTEAQLMVLARLFKGAHFLLLGDENQSIKEGTATFAQIRGVFENACGEGNVSLCRLATSYRSSPEITELFASLMPSDAALEVNSVQEAGMQPILHAYRDSNAYEAGLRDAAAEYARADGLSAIIASDAKSAWRISHALEGIDFTLLDGTAPLPDSGMVVTHVAFAKGLEFDRVIIPDADAQAYPARSDLARRKLYTAISRATRQLTVIANGALTPLLSR